MVDEAILAIDRKGTIALDPGRAQSLPRGMVLEPLCDPIISIQEAQSALATDGT